LSKWSKRCFYAFSLVGHWSINHKSKISPPVEIKRSIFDSSADLFSDPGYPIIRLDTRNGKKCVFIFFTSYLRTRSHSSVLYAFFDETTAHVARNDCGADTDRSHHHHGDDDL
jgi:hypothetical protein